MLDKSLVSVIIPAYNHAQFVQDTIQSIIAQTYQNIELIILDDGSKDDTWQKIQEMKSVCEKRFSKIHFETKENEGTCKTLNKLISLAKGEYIYLIASDDLAKPDAIEKLLENIKSSKSIVAVGDNEIINYKGERIGWDKKRNNCDLETAQYKTFGEFLKLKNKRETFGTYEELIKENHVPNGCLIARNALLQIPQFTTDAPLEDYYMHLQLAKIGTYCFIDDILFSYRWHQNNTIKQTEKIRIMSAKTLEHEEKIVLQFPDKKWEYIFKKEKYKTIMLFSLSNILKLYKTRDLNLKKTILEIFGHKFILKSKNMIK